MIRQIPDQLAAKEGLQRVRTELKDHLDQKEHLHRQIQGLEHQLSVLENQEDYLVEEITRYSTAFSSHNKLPPEILRYIFKHCIYEKDVVGLPLKDTGGAYTISRVSSSWRRIALDTPELWTSMSLRLTKANERHIRIARQWLSRGRTLPRSISIKQDSLECDAWGNNIILNLVAHYPLRSLELILPYKQLNQLKGLLDRSLSTLEVLRLKCFPGDTKLLPLLFCPGDTLLKLNTLILEGIWDLRNLNVVGSWSRIVHLDIKHELSVPGCFFIFQQCSRIKFCQLYVQDTSAVSTVSEIILPKIHALFIKTGGMTTKKLVDALTVPKLRHLAFEQLHHQAPGDVNTASFCQMIKRSQGLKFLSSFYMGSTSEPLNPLILLEKLPGLETVQISNGELDGYTINRISLGRVGPKLKKMTFKSRHDASEILRMVEARQQNASLNRYQPVAEVSSFTKIAFRCVSVSSSLEHQLISRKKALENKGKISIDLIFT